jgi:hypothetical protein
MKPGTMAGLLSWMFVVLIAGFLYFLFFDSWTMDAKFAWARVPLFRTRVILWVLISLIGILFLAIGGTRILAMQAGSGAEEFKRKNLILRSRQ